MNLVDRVKNILLTPTTEWGVIEAERSASGQLISSYVVPLAGASAVAGFIGQSLVGNSIVLFGTFRMPIVTGIGLAIFALVMAIVMCVIISAIINALAPSFGGQPNSEQAMKVAVYSFTPAWVAGLFQVLPALGILGLLGTLYSLYVLYLGLPKLMKSPADKAIGYTVVVVLCALVLSVVGFMVAGSFRALGMMGAAQIGESGEVQFDPNSMMGRLQQFGRGAEQAGRDMSAAERSSDPNAQVAAAASALGSLLGGGARVEPVSLDALRPLVPETFAALPRTSSKSERVGMAGIMIASAEATYGDGPRTAKLEMRDTGGVSGLVGLASWIGVEGERDDDSGTERNSRVNGRFTHQRMSKTGGNHEYAVVLGERFVVSASGRGMSFEELKAAVEDLDLAAIEALKGQAPPASR